MSVRRTSKSLVCIEVTQTTGEGPVRWDAVISIPGRDGTLERSFAGVRNQLDAHSLSDLSAWVALTVQNAVLTAYGAQGQLWTDGAAASDRPSL
jgi:hypothetical protein